MVDPYLVHEFATEFLDVGRKHDIEKTPSRLRLASWCFSARRRPPVGKMDKAELSAPSAMD